MCNVHFFITMDSLHAIQTVHTAGGALLQCLSTASERRAYGLQRVLLDCMNAVIVAQALTAAAQPLRVQVCIEHLH